MAQSTLEVILQMRSNAKAVLDADAAAIRGIADAATKAEGPLAGVETQLASTGRAAGTSGVSLQELVASYKATGTVLPEVVRQLVLQEEALLRAKDATTQTADATEGASTKTKEAATAQDALTSALKRYLTTGAILGAIKSSGDYADQLQNLSLQNNIGVESLQRLSYAASQNGDALTDLTRVIGVMSDKLGSGDASAVQGLKDLGLSFDAIRASAPDEAFLTISAAIAKIADPMEQARLKTDLFGRSALQIPTIASDMRALGDEAERTGQVMDASVVAAAARFDQTLDNLTMRLKVGVAEGLQPFFQIVGSGADIVDALTQSTKSAGDAVEITWQEFDTWGRTITDLSTGLSNIAFLVEEATGKIRDIPSVTGPAAKSADAFWKALRGDVAAASLQPIKFIPKDINDIEAALAKEYETLLKTTPAVDAHAKALQSISDKLSGAGLLQQAADYVTTVQNLGGVSHLTASEQADVNKILGDALIKYQALGQTAPKALLDIYAATLPLIPATQGWSDALLNLGQRVSVLEDPALTAGINDIIGGMGTLTTATDTAGVEAGLLTGAYQQFGLKTTAELKAVADAAVIHFQVLRDSGTATPEQIQTAFEQMKDAVKAANGEIPSQWETEIWPRISSVLGYMRGGFADWATEVIRGTSSLKVGLEGFWQDIKNSFFNVLRQMIDYFTQTFLKGLLAAITGAQGGFAGAFANLFSGATGGGGGGTGGLAQSAIGALFGAGGAGVGTSIGAGVGAGAGAAGLGVSAGPVGIGAGIGGGGFMAGAGGAALGAGAIGGAGLGLGYLGTKLFGGSGWKASGFGAASGAGTGALIGTMVFPGIGTALGAAIGGLAGAIGGWIGKSQGEKVNDARDQFFATIGKEHGATGGATGAGLDTGSSVIAAKLTQATGQAGGGQAFQNLITAKDQKALGVAAQTVLDILVKQKDAEDAIAAAAAKAGEEATLAGQAAAAAAAVEQAAVDQAKAAWEAKAATIKTSIAELATQQQQLADSIKGEAAESVMGVVESRTRAEIDALAAKSAQLEKDLAAGTAATTTGLTTTIEATTAGMIVAGDTIGTAVIPKLEDMINRGINPAKDALGGVFDLFGQASQAAIDFGNTAYDAFMHAKDGADALALGQSPDGIQQIRVELEGAGRAAKPFEQSLVRAFEAAKDGVDGIFSGSGRPRPDGRSARETVVAGSPISIHVTVGADAAGSKTTLSTNIREAFNDLVRRIDRNEDGLRTKLLRALRLEPA